MVPAFEQRREITGVTLAALFGEFLRASLCGLGGGPVWVRHGVVERRHWLSDAEFADILSLCQFMPGPNVVGIAVCVGERLCGGVGALAALSGFLVIPWIVGLAAGVLLLEYAHLPLLQHILGGISAAAAGLLIATGVKLLLPCRRRPASLFFAALAFGLMTFGKLPLVAVLFSLAPLSIVVAALTRARW